MNKLFFVFPLLFISSCATKRNFPNKDVCFLLYDLKKEKYEEVFNENRCNKRFPAASTFKVALSVMGHDTGVLKDENTPVFKWNGVYTPVESWNMDQTPTSWMRNSVVWVSQEMTLKIGQEKIVQYLKDFKYGNEDMSGGLKYAWLTPAPFVRGPMQNSLKISAYEQVEFLKKLWRGELKASQQSQVLTQKIMARDQHPNGRVLIGKTGSGFENENLDIRLGWFVGHLDSKNSEYIVVFNFTDTEKQPPGIFGGREAKEMAINILRDKGLW